jgi:hypothetical protein
MESNDYEYKYLKYKIKYLKKYMSMVGGTLKCRCKVSKELIQAINGNTDVENNELPEKLCDCEIYNENQIKRGPNRGKIKNSMKKIEKLQRRINVIIAETGKMNKEKEEKEKEIQKEKEIIAEFEK